MKRWLALPVVTLLILAAGLIPSLMLKGTQRYEVVTPTLSLYQNSVRCSGALYPRHACQVMAGGLYEVLETYVAVGDQVEEGQAVARVKQVQNQSFYTYESRDYSGALQGSSQLEALAQLYGGEELLPEGLLGESGWQAAQQFLEAREEPSELLVTAPITGVVNTKLPLAGTVIRAGETLYGVNSHQSWLVLANVSEKQAMEVRLGDPVLVTGDALRGEWWGSITGISPQAKKVFNGTGYDTVVEMEITMEDLTGQYTAGISVKAQIFTEDAREVLTLPYEAVYQNESNAEYVLVVGPGRLEERLIQTGAELAEGVEIAQGLVRGEAVAVVPGYQDALPKVYLLEEGS